MYYYNISHVQYTGYQFGGASEDPHTICVDLATAGEERAEDLLLK